MNKQEVITILRNCASDFVNKWDSSEEMDNGIAEYADKIMHEYAAQSHTADVTDDDVKKRGIVFMQKCPKCDGQGIVSKPPYIAGDVHQWSSTSASFMCDVCDGQKIIPMALSRMPDDGWVKCSERLPDTTNEVGELIWVHIYINENTPPETARNNFDKTWIDRAGATVFPTHWRELPKSPTT